MARGRGEGGRLGEMRENVDVKVFLTKQSYVYNSMEWVQTRVEGLGCGRKTHGSQSVGVGGAARRALGGKGPICAL